MTRTFSLTVVLGVALFAAAPAWSQIQPDAFERAALVGETPASSQIVTSDAFERAALAGKTQGASTLELGSADAFERAALAGQPAGSSVIVTGDAFERAAANGDQRVPAASLPPDAFERALLNPEVSLAVPVLADHHSRMSPAEPASSPTVASSGRDVEWSQIAIGFVLGSLLALGLVLGIRAAGIRPVAH